MSLNLFMSRLDLHDSASITDLISKGTPPDVMVSKLNKSDLSVFSDSLYFNAEVQSAMQVHGYIRTNLTNLQSCQYYRRQGYTWDNAFSTFLTDNCVCKLSDWSWIILWCNLAKYLGVSGNDSDVNHYVLVDFG